MEEMTHTITQVRSKDGKGYEYTLKYGDHEATITMMQHNVDSVMLYFQRVIAAIDMFGNNWQPQMHSPTHIKRFDQKIARHPAKLKIEDDYSRQIPSGV